MKRLIPIAIVLLLGMSSAARAGYYAGASFISTDFEFDTAVESFSVDDSSFKVFAGRTFFTFLGLEASYRDLGTHTQTQGLTTVDVDLEAIDLSARGILPLGRLFTVFAKVGYANLKADGSFDVDGIIDSIDEDDWELMYGVGLDVNFGSHFGVRAEYEEYDIDDTLNSVSLGAFFRF